jgi:hypothetical protein
LNPGNSRVHAFSRIHEQCRSGRADEVADIKDEPSPQHFVQPHVAGRPCDDHQSIPVEQFDPTKDDEYESKAERYARKHSAQSERKIVVCSRQYSGGKHGTESNEGSRQDCKGQRLRISRLVF